MIYQRFRIPKYGWDVQVYYHKSLYYVREIIEDLKIIGCDGLSLDDARNNLMRENLNSGLCYSNTKDHLTLIVIAKTSCPALFMNSWMHEARHLASHIEQEFNIDPHGEEAAYLCGYIGLKMHEEAKKFLCKCHCL